MFQEFLQNLFLRLKDVFLNFNFFPDIFDILLVTLLVYAVIVQLRRTQSIQVIKGIFFVVVVYGVVTLLNMPASSYLFNRLFNDIILIVIILFSAEIRQALEHMGARSFGKRLPFFSKKNEEEEIDAINSVCRACGAMSRNKVGSLILFQRETLLGDLTKQAVMINSDTTFEMLCSIFYPKAPLHDGAVIINNGKIVAARCVVPMKNDRVITENVGTRHRAALEASLNSDCVAVVTSEETGIISIAVDGTLKRGITDSELRELLGHYLLTKENEKRSKKKKKSDMITDEKHSEDENFALEEGNGNEQ
ncbi:MAG: diadenylate cyclase CdaA [Oscillospiraceae bacterium]|nr:diadenylate cyclase CdaA [Oscillospiraceae bacterium]